LSLSFIFSNIICKNELEQKYNQCTIQKQDEETHHMYLVKGIIIDNIQYYPSTLNFLKYIIPIFIDM